MTFHENVKVTMLGVAGTGKTCYMLAMYGVMGLGLDLGGFSIIIPEDGDFREIAEGWDSLIDPPKDRRSRWPPPTPGEPRTYKFSLCFALKNADPIIEFDWFEYRGGALVEFTPTSSAADVGALQNRIQATSSILICVSGEHLATSPGLADYKKIGVSRINQIVGESISNGNNAPPAVVIVITKFDLCQHREWEEIVADIQKMFQPFFAPEAGWLVLICPVTLGYDLKKGSASGEPEGKIQPVNVEHPIAFSLYAELLRKYWELDSSLGNNIESLNSLLDEEILPPLIFRRQAINRNEGNIEKLLGKIDKVANSLELMMRKLSTDNSKGNSRLFFEGKEVNFKDIFG